MQSAKWLLCLVILSMSLSAFGQHSQQSAPATISPLATTVCQSTFTSGSGPNYLQFCVTANGNITEFQSPLGEEHIREGTFGEGYGICDFTTLARYTDWAGFGDSGNWLPAIITQPGGPNTFPLKVVRTTSDGIWTLTQAFSRNTGELIAQVTMTLKNNTAVSHDFALLRYADIDANNANGGTFGNNFDFDHESAWGYNDGFNLYGVLLYTAPTRQFHFAFVQNTAIPPDPCSPVANLPTVPFFGDGSVGFDWNGTLGAGKSVIVTGKYKRF